jgi:hypothetical protein
LIGTECKTNFSKRKHKTNFSKTFFIGMEQNSKTNFCLQHKNVLVSRFVSQLKKQNKVCASNYVQFVLKPFKELNMFLKEFKCVCYAYRNTDSENFVHYMVKANPNFDFVNFCLLCNLFIFHEYWTLMDTQWIMMPCLKCSYFEFHQPHFVFHMHYRVILFFTLDMWINDLIDWQMKSLWHKYYFNPSSCYIAWLPEELFENICKQMNFFY